MPFSTYEIRALIPVVGGKRMEKVAERTSERAARLCYQEMAESNPFYFELVKVTRDEDCLEFTKDR